MFDMAFKIDKDWCNYLYLKGIIEVKSFRTQAQLAQSVDQAADMPTTCV